MELFDVIKKLFEPESSFKEVTDTEKRKYFFMINRILSIQYPHIANQFNHTRIDPVSTVNWWNSNLRGLYKTYPKWIFTSTKKAKAEINIKIDPIILKLLSEKFQFSKKDIIQCYKFWPKEMEIYMKDLASQLIVTENKDI